MRSDGRSVAAAVAAAVESPSHALTPGGPPLTCFYGRICMDDGEAGHGLDALLHGLASADLFMPLVTRDVIDGFLLAPKRRDPTLHEWEVALDRLRAGECLCLPILVGGVQVDADELPSSAHFASGISIRDTAVRFLSLPGLDLALGKDGHPTLDGLASVGAAVAEMLRAFTVQRGVLGDQLSLLDRYLEREWGRLKRLLDEGDVIGRGGFSTVYKGMLERNGGVQEVAVKAFAVSTAEVHYMRQFNEEAEIMLRLHHPVRGRAICGAVVYRSGGAL